MSSFEAALDTAPANLPAPARVFSPPPPLGFLATLGWLALGLLAAMLAVVATVIVSDTLGASIPKDFSGDDFFQKAALVAMLAAFCGTIVVACRRRGWSTLAYLGLVRPTGRYVRWGVLALVIPLTTVVLLSQLGDLSAGEDKVPATINELLITLLGIAIVAPIAEELMFRGFLFRGFAASRLGVVGTIVLTSVLWAALHDRTWLGFGEVFLCGVVWGWLRWKTGSTLETIAVHMANNSIAGIALAGVTLGWWSA
jgi:membrane protease YdiL (CAAX protease family)